MEKVIVILKVMGVVVPATGYVLIAQKLFKKFNRKNCGRLLFLTFPVNIAYGVQIFLFASMLGAPFHTAWLVCGLLISMATSATLLQLFFCNKF